MSSKKRRKALKNWHNNQLSKAVQPNAQKNEETREGESEEIKLH